MRSGWPGVVGTTVYSIELVVETTASVQSDEPSRCNCSLNAG